MKIATGEKHSVCVRDFNARMDHLAVKWIREHAFVKGDPKKFPKINLTQTAALLQGQPNVISHFQLKLL